MWCTVQIEFQCPLIQPDLPSKQGFLKQLREQLMPIVMESGILWNPQTVSSRVSLRAAISSRHPSPLAPQVNYKLLAEEALKATLQTAEAVYLPALRHAVFTNRLPGTPAGRGENSECDYAWFNVTSALGMQPPPVVRGLGVQYVIQAGVSVRAPLLTGAVAPGFVDSPTRCSTCPLRRWNWTTTTN